MKYFWISTLLLVTACESKYPKCTAEPDCHQGEFCVNQTCQRCRVDNDCPILQRCALGDCSRQATPPE